jgi:molecular chaperone GrpE (heat shock protein)
MVKTMIDKKIISEIERYKSINKYIMEQEAPAPIEPDLGALAPPPGGPAAPPAPAAPGVPPPPGGESEPQPIDVETDDEVTKIDDEGASEEGGGETEELEITDLVDSQKNIETKQDEYFNNLFGQIQNLESKLAEMDQIVNKLNSLEAKIEKYREKTPEEKLELRTYDSYPFNQKLSDFFDDKQIEMEKTGKNDYVLTTDDIKDINPKDIRNSFTPGGSEEEYRTSFR